MSELRTFLLQQCEKRDLSLRQASLRAGLDHSAVSRFVNGTRPTRGSSVKLARFFGVPEAYVLILAGHIIPPESFTPQSSLEWELLEKFRTLSAERQRIVLAQLDLELGLEVRLPRIIGDEEDSAK